MKPIITEDEIKKFAKDECIVNLWKIEYEQGEGKYSIDRDWLGKCYYEENRKDGFRVIKVNRDE